MKNTKNKMMRQRSTDARCEGHTTHDGAWAARARCVTPRAQVEHAQQRISTKFPYKKYKFINIEFQQNFHLLDNFYLICSSIKSWLIYTNMNIKFVAYCLTNDILIIPPFTKNNMIKTSTCKSINLMSNYRRYLNHTFVGFIGHACDLKLLVTIQKKNNLNKGGIEEFK